MKRTFTINLNNVVYHIDNDAYELLNQYLNEVQSRLSVDESKEVMADIEARISELFSERLQRGRSVVVLEDVEVVIAILGKPNQINENENENETTPPSHEEKRRFKKRFYRDMDNGVLGGVASGIAAYLGWDVVIIRVLLCVVLFIGYGMIIPIYLLIWIIAPAAQTIAQKLEMQGEEPTAERIKQEFNNMKNYVESDQFREKLNITRSKTGEFIASFFKVIVACFGVLLSIIGVVLLGVLLFLLSVFIFSPAVLFGFLPEVANIPNIWGIVLFVSVFLVAGIPIFSIIYYAIRIVSGKGLKMARKLGWVLLFIWSISLFLLVGLSTKFFVQLIQGGAQRASVHWSFDTDKSPAINEVRTVEPFQEIEVSGNIRLDLTQDTISHLQIIAQPSLIPYLETKTENGVLKIYTRKFFVNQEIKVHVVNPYFHRIQGAGSTKIRSFGTLKSDTMDILLSDASRVDLQVMVNNTMNVMLKGCSRATLEGEANSLNSHTNGVTQLDAHQLFARKAQVNASGLSNIDLNVSDTLLAVLNGAAQLQMEGKPLYKDVRSTNLSRVQL